jgi:hypothetical protein
LKNRESLGFLLFLLVYSFLQLRLKPSKPNAGYVPWAHVENPKTTKVYFSKMIVWMIYSKSYKDIHLMPNYRTITVDSNFLGTFSNFKLNKKLFSLITSPVQNFDKLWITAVKYQNHSNYLQEVFGLPNNVQFLNI